MSGRIQRDERGAELVEFAIVVPVFMLFVVAGLALLWLMFIKDASGQAAKEAARNASTTLRPAECDTPTPPSECAYQGPRAYPSPQRVADRVNARVPLFNLSGTDIDIVYRWYDQATTSVKQCRTSAEPAAVTACSGANPPASSEAMVTIHKQVPQVFAPLAGVFDLGPTINATAGGDTRAE